MQPHSLSRLIEQQIEALHAETFRLSEKLHHSGQLSRTSGNGRDSAFMTVLEDFGTAVEELRVSEEELRLQNEAIAEGQAEIERERRRYQELFDFAPDAYFITDENGVIREANHAVSALIGFARRYVLGKPLAAFVASEAQPRFQARLARLRGGAGDAVQEWEQAMRPRRYDRALTVVIRAAPVRDAGGVVTGLRWMMRDVTAHNRQADDMRALEAEAERRIGERTSQLEAANRMASALLAQQEADLAAVRTRYERLFRHAHDGLFRFSAEGRLLAVNPALARLLGYASPEAVLATETSVTHLVLNPGRHGALFRQLLSAGTLTDVEVEAVCADGGRMRLLATLWLERDAAGVVIAIEGTAAPVSRD